MTDLENMSIDEALVHFGTKGMKWGVRKGKKTAGVGRIRGAAIDRNDRDVAMLQKVKAGEKHKVVSALNRKVVGKQGYDTLLDNRINELNSQTERFKSGQVFLADRARVFATVSAAELFVSVRPR